MYEFERSQGKVANITHLKMSVWLGLYEGKGRLPCPSIRPNCELLKCWQISQNHGLLALLEVLLICGISHYSQAVAMSHSQASYLWEGKSNWFCMCVFLWFTILLFHFTSRFLAVYPFCISCVWGICRKHWEFWLVWWFQTALTHDN